MEYYNTKKRFCPHLLLTKNYAVETYRENIVHKLIRPRTPWHNGKVERSQNDRGRFYNFLSSCSYDDLLVQMKRCMRRAKRIPMAVLDCKSPIQKRRELQQAVL